MLTNQTTPVAKKSLQRQMTITLSFVIAGLILLVALPMGFISIRLQNEETRRMHQDLVSHVARDVGQILQDLQTNQLQILLNDAESTDVNVMLNPCRAASRDEANPRTNRFKVYFKS